MTYLKINALHCGIPANTNGIGEYIGYTIPTVDITAKAVMNTASLLDLQPYNKGHLIWRMDRFRDGSNDVPRYGSDIETEADRYWDEVLAVMPPELDRSKVWVELINEPSRLEWDWLGELCYALGQRALRDGMRVLCLGVNSGEPEPDAWFEAGMVKFLRLCATNPNQVGITLHEYSFSTDIWNQYPYLIGRFQVLYDTCDQLGISHPTTFVSEFGWGKDSNTFPSRDQALVDIHEVGALYARFPAIKGVVIWCLDTGSMWGNLGNQINDLMNNGLGDLVKNTVYDAPEPPDPPLGYKAIPVLCPQNWTLNQMLNVHTENFTDRRTITQSLDEAIRLVELGKVGSYVIVYDIEAWSTEEQNRLLAIPHELR